MRFVAAADIAVIGAGVVGLATAHALAERGAAVVVYERGVPGNGQSGGKSRIFRHAHDDPRLVAFACEARAVWREWEERFDRELLSRDGVISIGAALDRHLAIVHAVGGIRARRVCSAEILDRIPLLARLEERALLDEDGGVIDVRATIEALSTELRHRLAFDEVLSIRRTKSGTVELRAGGVRREYARVIVCAGRGTAALARGAGLAIPVRQAAHVRLTYRVRGKPPARLACLLDGSGAFGEPDAYAGALPGNHAYAVGLYDTPVHEDGSLVDAGALASAAHRTTAYVERALPGLDPLPVEARHCWVTELPWGEDGIGAWEIGGVLVVAGNNLFKHAPALGRALSRAALGEGLAPHLHPQAQLGSDITDPGAR